MKSKMKLGRKGEEIFISVKEIPDKATKSLVERPRELKREMSRERLEVGGGMPLLAAERLAVLASLLPSFTSQ